MLNRIFTFLYHFFWYAFAFVILNAAVVVTVARLALPEIGSYNAEIQAWVSKQMEHPVVINKINAEWEGWTPNLYLGNIDLYTQDNKSIITKLDSAHIGIDLVASIRAREIIPSYLAVTGLDFGITRHLDGTISITSDDTANLNNTTSSNSALSGWLLKQNYIILENAAVSWLDEKYPHKKKQFSNVRIQLKTDQERVQLEADTSLPEELGQTLSVKMDITGNILTANWDGEIYVETNQLRPADLLDEYAIKSAGGSANIKLWTNWQKSRLIDFNGEATYAAFSLHTKNSQLAIDNLNLTLFGKRQQQHDWLLNIELDDLKTSDKQWPSSSHQVLIEKGLTNNRYKAHSSYLNLGDTLPFLLTVDGVPEIIKTQLTQQTVEAELTDLNISYEPDAIITEQIKLDTDFKNLAYTSADKKDAFSGLAGKLTVNGESIKIQLNNESSLLKLGAIYDRPYTFSQINAELELSSANTPELIIKNLNAVTEHLNINASGRIRLEKQSPFIDIVARVGATDIENVAAYLPKQTDAELRTWFNRALVGGKLLSTDVIFHGYLNDYPFKNAEGHFKTIMNIDNITLDYNEEWPVIDNFTAELVIENDVLKMQSRTGKIFDATINSLTGEIRDLSKTNRHLVLDGSLNGHTSDARNFIAQSPINENKSLRESMGNIAGKFELDLKLDIPFGPEKTKVDGLVTFTDTTIVSALPGLELDDVDGKVSFTRDEVWADELNALYSGVPVKLIIPRIAQDSPYSESYKLDFVASKAFIVNQLGSFFPSFSETGKSISNYIEGESNWTVSINNLKGQDEKEVLFTTDLEGFEVNLPYPFGKKKGEPRTFSISTNLAKVSINHINFNYDDLFFTDVIVDNSQNLMVKNILIGLGTQHTESTDDSDISIQGSIEQLNLSEWIDIIAIDTIASSQSDKTLTKHQKITGDFNVASLKIFDNQFTDVNLNITNPTDGWKISFTGNEINGDAQLVNDINTQQNKLRINLASLSIHESEKNKTSDKTDINKIPDLDINVDQFSYKNNLLGKFNLQTSHLDNGINIDTLSISKAGFSINANGTWTRTNDIDHSSFYAKLESDSIENMLSTFNYTSANIKDGKTIIEMNANWMDTPMNFSMEKIDGQLNMDIDKGQFLDIDPSAGRLFGLLSLQTLPRRLALDFTDLFNKGFSFDSIRGDFSMEQGHAYTNDLEMIGPAANIAVSGRTGLITQDYDQIATITPKVSNSLPVASALFGPIGVGVGAVIYLTGELFKSIPDKIDNILRYQYSIKGSWENPDIVKIKKESKSG